MDGEEKLSPEKALALLTELCDLAHKMVAAMYRENERHNNWLPVPPMFWFKLGEAYALLNTDLEMLKKGVGS